MLMQNSNYEVLARYEAGSNTVRKVPENYCLIAFDGEGQPKFDAEAATLPYRINGRQRTAHRRSVWPHRSVLL